VYLDYVPGDYVPDGEITLLLHQWRSGDLDAGERLTPLAYDQLRKIAESYLRRERPDNSLQPTELVNELFVELLKLNRLTWKDRSHFFVFSAKIMRQILIGHARKSKAAKRGGELEHLPLNAELDWIGAMDVPETLDLAAALDVPTATGRLSSRPFMRVLPRTPSRGHSTGKPPEPSHRAHISACLFQGRPNTPLHPRPLGERTSIGKHHARAFDRLPASRPRTLKPLLPGV
jgi:RNA polymerase sigma factor (TIGR02999 family)